MQQVIQSGGPNEAALIKRGYMALEDEEYEVAEKYFNQILDMNAESVDAYLGQLLADLHVRNIKEQANISYSKLSQNRNFQRIMHLANVT